MSKIIDIMIVLMTFIILVVMGLEKSYLGKAYILRQLYFRGCYWLHGKRPAIAEFCYKVGENYMK